jgi:hypothetical protein
MVVAKSFYCFSIIFLAPSLIAGFLSTTGPSKCFGKRCIPFPLHHSPHDDPPPEPPKEAFDWDLFLDTPFFDPDQVVKDPNSPPLLRRIAAWVQEDYATAELTATGVLFVVLIIASQELLRIQMYGLENYVPFTKSVLPGNLF